MGCARNERNHLNFRKVTGYGCDDWNQKKLREKMKGDRNDQNNLKLKERQELVVKTHIT